MTQHAGVRAPAVYCVVPPSPVMGLHNIDINIHQMVTYFPLGHLFTLGWTGNSSTVPCQRPKHYAGIVSRDWRRCRMQYYGKDCLQRSPSCSSSTTALCDIPGQYMYSWWDRHVWGCIWVLFIPERFCKGLFELLSLCAWITLKSLWQHGHKPSKHSNTFFIMLKVKRSEKAFGNVDGTALQGMVELL